MPDNKIRVMVEDGCVTLSGQVEWQYQRQILANGAEVTLRGTVHSWAERRAAEGAPGRHRAWPTWSTICWSSYEPPPGRSEGGSHRSA